MNSQFQWSPGIRGRVVSSTERKGVSGEENSFPTVRCARTTGIADWKEFANPLAGTNHSENNPTHHEYEARWEIPIEDRPRAIASHSRTLMLIFANTPGLGLHGSACERSIPALS
jgi:hypothetical protein